MRGPSITSTEEAEKLLADRVMKGFIEPYVIFTGKQAK